MMLDAPVSGLRAEGGGVRWSELRRDDPEALRRAESEALEMARALAVESLASDRDAELVELDERRRHLSSAAWPAAPLEGYRLQSSLGAFVLARVAIAWVPAGQMGLRHRPLGADAVLRGLIQQGVDPVLARSVLGDWLGPHEGFRGTVEGLDAGSLAGLTERTLTRSERDAALSQVAASPRDLSRLAACLVLARSVRRLLPVLPGDGHGERLAATLALVATDRADRALELLSAPGGGGSGVGEASPLEQAGGPPLAEGLGTRAVRELALAIVALRSGQSFELEPDLWAPAPPLIPSEPTSSEADDTVPDDGAASISGEGFGSGAEPEHPATGWAAAEPVPPLDEGADSDHGGPPPSPSLEADDYDEADDVLEIVEEAVDPEALEATGGPSLSEDFEAGAAGLGDALLEAVSEASGAAWVTGERPRVPPWWPQSPEGADEAAPWRMLESHRALVVRQGALLGLRPARPDPRGGPVPPDPRLSVDSGSSSLGVAFDVHEAAPGLEGKLTEAFLPPVRTALRAVLAAAHGAPPDLATGDVHGLAWIFARARAIAELSRGRLAAAREAVAALTEAEAPELRWIRALEMRYEGRKPVPPSLDEIRAAAAVIVLDLARSLARTLAGEPCE